MPRFQPVRHETGSEEQRQLLDAVKHKLGRVPNVLATLANAPAALRMYLGAGEALAGGRISPTLREKIALAVAEANGCEYCLAAHSAVGKSLGLSPDEIVRNPAGRVGGRPHGRRTRIRSRRRGETGLGGRRGRRRRAERRFR